MGLSKLDKFIPIHGILQVLQVVLEAMVRYALNGLDYFWDCVWVRTQCGVYMVLYQAERYGHKWETFWGYTCCCIMVRLGSSRKYRDIISISHCDSGIDQVQTVGCYHKSNATQRGVAWVIGCWLYLSQGVNLFVSNIFCEKWVNNAKTKNW